jgi:adenosyl cobinamide kinase/adenosyl cobinamide phosphate guanylyltransferase
MPLTLLIGGARSGKSDIAMQMASRQSGPVVFVATAEAGDGDMAARIARHRDARPADWTTVESPHDITGALAEAIGFVILDCVTLWVSNLIGREMTDADVVRRAHEAAAVAASRRDPTVVVTNEVGSGIVPDNPLARRYRDLLGTVNKTWADAADTTLLVVAGRTLELGGA